MNTITETADLIDDAIHKLFDVEPDDARPFVRVIIALIENLRSRLDTVWFYPLEKMDGTVGRLKGFIGEANTDMSPGQDLQFAFADWSLAKRNLAGINELPRSQPTENQLQG